MIRSKTIKVAMSGLLCLAGSSILSAQFVTDEKFWSQAHFTKSFQDSYAMNKTTEPTLEEEEQVIIKEVLTFLETNPKDKKGALAMLEPQITAEGTAAFDFIAANFYAELGDLKSAIRYYDQAVVKFPSFLRAIKNTAIMKVKEGRFLAAQKDFIRAIELGAKDTTTMGLLGLCYVNTEQYISAETAYREAMILDPTVKDWQLGLAKSLTFQGKNEETIAVIEQILVSEPESDVLWTVQANAYLGKDDPETSVAIHEIIDRLGKSTAESLVYMGNVYMSRGLNDLALGYFQRAIQKDPNQDADVHIGIAESLTARGAYDQAVEIIGDVRSSFGSKLVSKEELRLLRIEAQILLATGQGEKVIPILESLIEKDPLDGQALLLLAEFYSGRGDDDGDARADLFFERATKVRDWEVRALISWARSYVAREEFGKAIPLLERANIRDPQEHITRYLEQVRKVYLAKLGL